MLIASIGFYQKNIPLLLVTLFLMGMQSSIFGPIKYSIIPQHLSKDELIGGNALVESGTFIAILLGTMLGGILIGISGNKILLVPYTIISLSILGFLASLKIPTAPATDPELKINWNPLIETFKNLSILRENKTVFNSVLGISWFWLLGATYITQLPNYTRLSLNANEQVLTLLLALFCVGIGTGSLLCERLSGRTVELGLVPIGSIGLTVFGADVFFATHYQATAELAGIQAFIHNHANWRLSIDIFLLGVFGGIYIVPLYALIQTRSNPKRRSRVIAGNNILNALFITFAGIFAILLFSLGFSIPELFFTAALINAVVAIYIYTLIPEFTMRFCIWILVHLVYRVKKIDLHKIPKEGPAVVVCNHVSLMDALIIGGCVQRPIRFVMYHKIYNIPFLHFIFKTAQVIPIAPKKEDPELLENAYQRIAEELRQGNIVGLFPEGKLTSDGNVDTFKPGIERILNETPVPVVPLALQGLWGSYFSNRYSKPLQGIPHKLWPKIAIYCGDAITPESASAEKLHHLVVDLLDKKSKHI